MVKLYLLIEYSALTYAYNTVCAADAGQGLKNTVKALYLYNQATKAYNNWLKN